MRVPHRKKEDDRFALMQHDYHVTAEKLESMKRTREQLKKDRPSLVLELQTAREMGDLSENAAYTIAKSNLRKLDGRVMSLDERIKQAVVIEKSDNGKVSLGATVILAHEGGERSYEIVGPSETDPAKGRVSFQSPLGALLLNKVVGDEIVVNDRVLGKIARIE